MLDKTIPFHVIIMRRACLPPPVVALPEPYLLRSYLPGDELAWAQIEASVLEFDSVEDAFACHVHYMKSLKNLSQRQWFVVRRDNGLAVATATAWFTQTENGIIPTVYALACGPAYQGQGLAKQLRRKCWRPLMRWTAARRCGWKRKRGEVRDPAIGLYLKLGFVPLKRGDFGKAKNEYDAALPVLWEKMTGSAFRRFVDMSI